MYYRPTIKLKTVIAEAVNVRATEAQRDDKLSLNYQLTANLIQSITDNDYSVKDPFT